MARAVYSRLHLIVLDDILSAVDARTEQQLIDRLFGKTGLLRRLNSTVILATHAGKHVPYSGFEGAPTDQLIPLVRHLSLADKIVVLGADGQIAEQGTFNSLASQGGFVSKLLFHPELNDDPRVDSGLGPNTKPAATALNTPIGASRNDAEDLTRQIGDLSVYKYYLRSIGWKLALVNAISCLLWGLGVTFPCE